MAKHCNIDRVLSIYFELYTYNLSFMFYVLTCIYIEITSIKQVI